MSGSHVGRPSAVEQGKIDILLIQRLAQKRHIFSQQMAAARVILTLLIVVLIARRVRG